MCEFFVPASLLMRYWSPVMPLDLQEYSEQVGQRFCDPTTTAKAIGELQELLQSITGPLRFPGEAFHRNLVAVALSIGLPFQLSHGAARTLRLYQLALASAVRLVIDPTRRRSGDGLPTLADVEPEAISIANTTLSVEEETDVGFRALLEGTNTLLAWSLTSEEVREAAQEVLNQGLVLLWGSFEVIARDVFEVCLNRKPDWSIRLLSSPDGKKYFPWKPDAALLQEFGFDLSTKMGSALLRVQGMTSLESIRSTYCALFDGDPGLRDLLNDERLWRLGQRRHLLVHRRGVIDRDFLVRTGYSYALGERLPTTAQDFADAFFVVSRVGGAILRAACSRLLATTDEQTE